MVQGMRCSDVYGVNTGVLNKILQAVVDVPDGKCGGKGFRRFLLMPQHGFYLVVLSLHQLYIVRKIVRNAPRTDNAPPECLHIPCLYRLSKNYSTLMESLFTGSRGKILYGSWLVAIGHS
jgi:hypothetical protein